MKNWKILFSFIIQLGELTANYGKESYNYIHNSLAIKYLIFYFDLKVGRNYRTIYGATILNNSVSNTYLIKTLNVGPNAFYFKSCQYQCNLNPKCSVAVHDITQQYCRLYSSEAMGCFSIRSINDTIIYDTNIDK